MPDAMSDETTLSASPSLSAFRTVPRTGVIYVTTEAAKRGFRAHDPAWCNLGQGQPETGPLPGAPARVHRVAIDVDDQEYAPIPGIPELREAIADLYNRLYRRGMPSRYSAENVSVSGGGRAALTRAAASLGHVNLGHFLPDYTAYGVAVDGPGAQNASATGTLGRWLADVVRANPATFRVSARRADKRFPLTSPQIEREVGGRIKEARNWRAKCAVDRCAARAMSGIEISSS